MKATLKFNLPEEREEFELATKAGEMRTVIHEIEERMRRELKGDNVFKEVDDVCRWVRSMLVEVFY